jgi:tyrosine-protein phosphatase YwqE
MFGLFKNSPVIPDLSFIGVDMHSHLLPGLDDGLETLEQSVAFVKELKLLGYEKLICTPHILSDFYKNSPETILPKLLQLKEALVENDVSIKLEAAAEYMIDYEFEELVYSGIPLLTFGNNNILVEMSYLAVSPNFEKMIFELKLRGLNPILAHPERYNFFHQDFQNYQRLKDIGCLLQVNLLSLAGYYGKPVRKAALKLIDENMIDFIGTDMHHLDHLEAMKAFTSHKDFYKIVKDVPFKNRMLL